MPELSLVVVSTKYEREGTLSAYMCLQGCHLSALYFTSGFQASRLFRLFPIDRESRKFQILEPEIRSRVATTTSERIDGEHELIGRSQYVSWRATFCQPFFEWNTAFATTREMSPPSVSVPNGRNPIVYHSRRVQQENLDAAASLASPIPSSLGRRFFMPFRSPSSAVRAVATSRSRRK